MFRFHSSHVDIETIVEIQHKLERVNTAFRYLSKEGILRGTIATGNDVGWCCLPFAFKLTDGRKITQSVSFEILPTKMAMDMDLQQMYKQLDAGYPLWRFSTSRLTEQASDNGSRGDTFLLMWLAQFGRLYQEMMTAFKIVKNCPHRRLLSEKNLVRLDRLKGRLTHKTEETVCDGRASAKDNIRFVSVNSHLDTDTPENRFVKFILQYALHRLQQVECVVTEANNRPESTIFSEVFFQQLFIWKKDIHRLRDRKSVV